MLKIASFPPRFAARFTAACVLLLAVASAGVAQQITCPVANPATNTSATATNSVNPCTIQALAIYTNSSTGTLTNETGASLVNDGGLTNNGKILNDANATLTNNASLINASGATLSNSGVFVGTGATQNYGALNNLGSGSIINVVDNFGGTITNKGLSVYLSSGSDIQGGTLNGGNGPANWGNNVTLDGSSSYGALTIQGTVGNDSTINTTTNFEGTINNQGKIVVSAAFGGDAHVSLIDNTTLQGGGTVTLNGGIIQNGSGSLTNVNNTIQGSGVIAPGNVSFVNQGTVNANVSGATLTLFANSVNPVSNTGTIEATGGGVLTVVSGLVNNGSGGLIVTDASSTFQNLAELVNNVGGKISNAGTFDNEGPLYNNGGATIVNSGVLNGAGTIVNYGTITNLGSISSVINNFGGTITTGNGATGGILLGNGSDIAGGTLNAGSAGHLIVLGNNVTLNGSGGFGALTLQGELAILPTMATTLYMDGTINNEGILQLDGTTSPINVILNGNTTLQGGGTVRLLGGPLNLMGGGVDQPGTGIIISGPGTLTNVNNTIQGSALISVGAFVNQGTVNANAGGQELILSSAVTNTGVMEATAGGTLTLQSNTVNNNSGGSIITEASSTVVVDAALNNSAGAKIVDAGTLSFSNNVSNAGSLEIKSGGVLNNGAAATLVNSGTLQNDAGGSIINYGGIVNNKGATFINDGSFVDKAGSLFINYGTFTLGSGSSFESGGYFSNVGTMNVNPGATLTNPGGYVQTGGQTVVNGTLNSASVEIQGGTFSGAGTVTGSVLNSGGVVRPGGNGTPGTLAVQGYEQQSGASFDELIGASGNGLLVAGSGGITLDSGSLLDIDLLNGFTPTDGETFDIMGANQMSGTFANAPTTGFQMDGFNWTIAYDDPGEIVLDAVSPVSGTTPAPEPSSFLLLVPSLAALAFLRRRAKEGQA